jgi:hypothetical protein
MFSWMARRKPDAAPNFWEAASRGFGVPRGAFLPDSKSRSEVPDGSLHFG